MRRILAVSTAVVILLSAKTLLAAPVGFKFAETLIGEGTIDGKKVKVSVSFNVSIADLDRWAEDETHPAQLVGTLTVDGGAAIPVTGLMNVLAKATALGGDKGYYLGYRFKSEDRKYRFVGTKLVRRDSSEDIITQTSKVYGQFVAPDAKTTLTEAATSYTAWMQLHWWEPSTLAKFVGSFKPVNAGGLIGRLKATKKFITVVFGSLRKEFLPFLK